MPIGKQIVIRLCQSLVSLPPEVTMVFYVTEYINKDDENPKTIPGSLHSEHTRVDGIRRRQMFTGIISC